jgi:uncharacterized cupin superfamily protein
MPLKLAHIPSLPEIHAKSPTGKYESYCKDVSLALGGVRDTGAWGGGHPFDLQQRRVPPGASVCPLHMHTAQWELFIVICGTGTVRIGDGTKTVVGVGDAFVQPPGTAHQITNTGREDLVFQVIADNLPVDSTFYPESNKWQIKPQRKLFRMQETDYFNGEE